MPLPVAHGLVGASVVAALRPANQPGRWKWLAFGAFLGIAPDFDFALNWLRISWGGWHHGFTHSIPFALIVGLATIIVLRQWKLRSFLVVTGAYLSHTLLDFMLTESRGVALWWPFTNHRYKLRLPNPIDYTWSDDSFTQAAVDLLKISLIELLIFAPILLAVISVRQIVNKRSHVFIWIFLVVCPVVAQDKADLKAGARVDPGKPTVYLELVCQDKSQAHLRMHNNTIWNILVRTNDLYYEVRKPIELLSGVKTHALPGDKEISLQYRVEPFSVNPHKVKMPRVTNYDNSFSAWVASKDSIQFLVPMAFLRKDLQVVVNFQYEWEVVKPTYSNDPEHRVTFRGIDLPPANRAKCSVAKNVSSKK